MQTLTPSLLSEPSEGYEELAKKAGINTLVIPETKKRNDFLRYLLREEIPVYSNKKVNSFLRREVIKLSILKNLGLISVIFLGIAISLTLVISPFFIGDQIKFTGLRMLSVISGIIIFIVSCLGFQRIKRYTLDWKNISSYRLPIPHEVLSLVAKLKEECDLSHYQFEISNIEYNIKPLIIDPFLRVEINSEFFVVAYWDEPGFSLNPRKRK